MNEQGKGWDLVRALGLDVAKSDAWGPYCRCAYCPSSDAMHVNAESGSFKCLSCAKAGGAYELACHALKEKKAAVETLIRIGIFQDRAFAHAVGADHAADSPRRATMHRIDGGKSRVDPLDALAAAKGAPRAGFEALGAEPMGGKSNGVRIPMWDASLKCCGWAQIDVTSKNPTYVKGWYKSGSKHGLFLDAKAPPQPGETIIVVEGPKDAAWLLCNGYRAVGLPTCTLGASLASLLAGCSIVMVPDRDIVARRSLEKNARVLSGLAASIRFAVLPCEERDSDGEDVRDIAKRHGADAVHAAIRDARAWVPSNADRTKAVFSFDPLRESELSSEAIEVLGTAARDEALPFEARVFDRGGLPARIREDSQEGLHIHLIGDPIEISDAMGFSIEWYRESERGKKAAIPQPSGIAKRVLHRGVKPFPTLREIVTAPPLAPDGSLVLQPGYSHAASRYARFNAAEFRGIPDLPTHADAYEALDALLEPFEEFPLEDEASRWNLVALLLTPFLRPLYGSISPLFVIDAAEPGSGKSRIANAVSVIYSGDDYGRVPMSRDEEMDKQIGAALATGKPILCIDNVKGCVVSGNLESQLTAKFWRGRVLGTNTRTASFDNLATWCVTGNNIELGSEIRRRAVLIRLVPQQRRVEDFKIKELEQWIRSNRARLCCAALTIARAWIAAGRPCVETAPLLGSFEAWSRCVGAVALWLDGEILANRKRLAEANDVELAEWRGFLLALAGASPSACSTGLTTAEIVALVRLQRDVFESALPGELAEHIERGGFAHRVGKALRRRCGRRHGDDGLKVMEGEMCRHTKHVRWRIEAP